MLMQILNLAAFHGCDRPLCCEQTDGWTDVEKERWMDTLDSWTERQRQTGRQDGQTDRNSQCAPPPVLSQLRDTEKSG